MTLLEAVELLILAAVVHLAGFRLTERSKLWWARVIIVRVLLWTAFGFVVLWAI